MSVSPLGIGPSLVASGMGGIDMQLQAQGAAQMEGQGILNMITPPPPPPPGIGQNINALA